MHCARVTENGVNHQTKTTDIFPIFVQKIRQNFSKIISMKYQVIFCVKSKNFFFFFFLILSVLFVVILKFKLLTLEPLLCLCAKLDHPAVMGCLINKKVSINCLVF